MSGRKTVRFEAFRGVRSCKLERRGAMALPAALLKLSQIQQEQSASLQSLDRLTEQPLNCMKIR